LAGAGIDLVGLANNHALDFGVEGLLDTLQYLRKCGIAHAGAGADIGEALTPAIVERRGISFGMAAFCDHQEDFAAGRDCAGIACLDLNDEQAAIGRLRHALQPLLHAAVDWPILSLHWGPNMVFRPASRLRRIAHAAIDMGWKILFGHSAHVFQGIEIIRGCPVFYAAGDLIDDYYVDPDFRNDHQMLFSLELTRDNVRCIELHPVFIERCRTRPASQEQSAYIATQMRALCMELGTRVEERDGRLWINVTSSG
jgi:poly-gamma-glutamate capsule biosynthesis protein CapA/YwtB (metallophosphatase superfamily)